MAIDLGDFLRSLPPHEVERILGDARRRRFQRSDIVFHEGDAGDTIHVVTSGRFGVQTGTADGDRVMLQIVAAGDVFGELSIFGADRRRTATVGSGTGESLVYSLRPVCRSRWVVALAEERVTRSFTDEGRQRFLHEG